MMIEESGSETIPLTYGSGSRRPKNMWIRIRNTANEYFLYVRCSVADPDPGSGAFLTPGSEIRDPE